MSNKAWDKINELDKLIRQTLNLGMHDNDTYLQIEFIWGFELFNTRPYHNYETWSGGYRVIDKRNNIVVEQEDLDDAIKLWASLVTKVKAGEQLLPYQTLKRLKYLEQTSPKSTEKETISDGTLNVPVKP